MEYIAGAPEGIDTYSILFKLFEDRCEELDKLATSSAFCENAYDKFYELIEALKEVLNDEAKERLEKALDALNDYRVASDFLYYSAGFKDSFKLKGELEAL